MISNHEQLVSSLLKGNATTAERNAEEHNKAAGELLVRYLQEQETSRRKRDPRRA